MTRVNSIIAALNDTIQDVSEWKTVCELILDLFNGNYAYFNLVDMTTCTPVFVASSSADHQLVRSYWDQGFRSDPWFAISQNMAENTVACDSDLIDAEELVASPFYDEFLKPYDCHFLLTGAALRSRDLRGYVGILRAEKSGPFSSADREALSRILPHVKTALLVYLELSRQRQGFKGLADGIMSAFGFGSVLLNQEGRVLASNRVAQELLSTQPLIQLQGDRLEVGDHAQLKAAFDELSLYLSANDSSKRFFEIMTLKLPDSTTSSVLRIVMGSIHLPQDSLKIRDPLVPQAYVMMVDPDKVNQSVDQSYLKSRYGLSRAEIRVAESLVIGMTVTKMAEMYDVSAETVRSQLKSIYQKTNVNSQVALFQLIMDHAVVQLPTGIQHEQLNFDRNQYELIY